MQALGIFFYYVAFKSYKTKNLVVPSTKLEKEEAKNMEAVRPMLASNVDTNGSGSNIDLGQLLLPLSVDKDDDTNIKMHQLPVLSTTDKEDGVAATLRHSLAPPFADEDDTAGNDAPTLTPLKKKIICNHNLTIYI